MKTISVGGLEIMTSLTIVAPNIISSLHCCLLCHVVWLFSWRTLANVYNFFFYCSQTAFTFFRILNVVFLSHNKFDISCFSFWAFILLTTHNNLYIADIKKNININNYAIYQSISLFVNLPMFVHLSQSF